MTDRKSRTPEEISAEARRIVKNQPFRPVVMGVKLEPPPPPPVRKTYIGVAPPAPQSAPQPPPPPLLPIESKEPTKTGIAPPSTRSMSPPGGTDVSLPDGSRVKTHTLRKLWMFVGPVVITIATSVFGYFKGKVFGIIAQHEEIVQMQARTKIDHEELERFKAEITLRVEGIDRGLSAESSSNRAERATALERYQSIATDVEKLKDSTPKIQGLIKK